MKDEKCPRCSEALTTLQSSGRKVCRSCGWVSRLNELNSQDNSPKKTEEPKRLPQLEETSSSNQKSKTNQFNFCPKCGKHLLEQEAELNEQECKSCGWKISETLPTSKSQVNKPKKQGKFKIIGIVLIAVSVFNIVNGRSMETTVSTDSGQVYSIGLIQKQNQRVQVGGIALIAGIILCVLDKQNN
jgi:transcription initiation factor TFIIIB Brf1 subunit/transcription initiation factor TFIIB